jgi:HAD superfamily hydrolase (TIGR01549 family)
VAKALLFDIDGTLIDSVDLHAKAWQEALARFGKQVDYNDLRSRIGKGGDRILPELLSEEELSAFGDELAEFRSDLFQRQFLPWAQPFPQARELLVTLKRAGVLVGLASSCSRAELGQYLRLLDGASVVDAAVHADEVESSKPSPEVFQLCLEKLDVEPGVALAVGDSPYDAEAAGRAGIVTVGLLSGGFPEQALEAAGCVALYEDPAELLSRIGTAPLTLEPAERAEPPK